MPRRAFLSGAVVTVLLLALSTAGSVLGASPVVPPPTPSSSAAVGPSPRPSPTPSPLPQPTLASTPATDPPELRAVWVDAFHDGFKTARQVDDLVDWARLANLNALFVEVRRRGDAYYLQSFEPRTEDGDLQPGFDALQYLIQRAHSGPQPLQVHAWLATLPIWDKWDTAPLAPTHVFNQHGPDDRTGTTWLMLRDDGQAWAGDDDHGMYYLDPGNPAAAQYTADVYANVVRNYDVDGIHLDQVRYYEGDPTRWGYNPTSVARFNQAHGRDPSTQPDADDPEWAAWRREQVTELVRRVYQQTKALKPNLAVSAAVVAWGRGPDATATGWQRTAAYSVVYQDWQRWLREGIVDYLLPMDYYREDDDRQAGWFDNWTSWQEANVGQRAVVLGAGTYLNDAAGAQAQLERARALRPLGVAIYSYALPFQDADNRRPEDRQRTAAWLQQIFPHPAPVPRLPWLAQ
jgi:uncharacterized lipoprotein YddW (UPF0748 family)